MKDYIVRATAAGGTVRAFAAATTNLVSEAKKLHGMTPLATAALGRSLTAAVMMSKLLKGHKDTLTLQIKGDGPLEGLVVVTDPGANVRGYVYNPNVELPLNDVGKFDVSGAIGGGYLNVIKDLGLKEPYIGYVNLISGEIGDDIAYYFAYSEQVPSIVSLGVLIDKDETVLHAGGYIIQLMPGASEDMVDYLESKVFSTPSTTKLMAEGKSPEDILELILGEKELKITDTSSCKYVCNCSRERMERNILSLGRQEIENLMAEQHGAELQCHFCNEKYRFTEEELKSLIED